MGDERFTDGEVEIVKEPERRVSERREAGRDVDDYSGPGAREGDRRQSPPELTRCPQCGSMYCGPIRCRFSGLGHFVFEKAGDNCPKCGLQWKKCLCA